MLRVTQEPATPCPSRAVSIGQPAFWKPKDSTRLPRPKRQPFLPTTSQPVGGPDFRRLGVSFQGIEYSVQTLTPQVQQGQNDCCQGPLKVSGSKVGDFSVSGERKAPYFLVPKKDSGFHPILDLRQLNQFVKVLPFHMLRKAVVLQVVSEGDCLQALI